MQVIHRARFAHDLAHIAPGEESLDVRLFPIADIPWDELAFPSVHWALDAWLASRGRPLGAPATNPTIDPRGVVAPELSATVSRAATP